MKTNLNLNLKLNHLTRIVCLGLITTSSILAQAGYSAFDLDRNEGQVCKYDYSESGVKNQKPALCLKLAEAENKNIEIVDQSQYILTHKSPTDILSDETIEYSKNAGGTSFLSQKELKYVVKNYKTLSLRDVTYDFKQASLDVSGNTPKMRVPLLARLFWKGHLGTNATLLMEGQIVISLEDLTNLILDNSNRSESLLNMTNIQSYSDTCTEASKFNLCFRGLEKFARFVNYKMINFTDADNQFHSLDEQTLNLLHNIATKVIIGEFYSRLTNEVSETLNPFTSNFLIK